VYSHKFYRLFAGKVLYLHAENRYTSMRAARQSRRLLPKRLQRYYFFARYARGKAIFLNLPIKAYPLEKKRKRKEPKE